MNKITTRFLLCACAIAILLRVVPLPVGYNVSALGALALLSGAHAPSAWLALALPLGCRAVTDCWIELQTGYGFYDSMLFDYLAYAGVSLLGRLLSPRQALAVFGTAAASTVLFFVVSNFGVWLLSPDHAYTRDLSGLQLCYIKGLPFARGTFIGDLLFSAIFFGAWQLVTSHVRQTAVSASDSVVS